MAFNVNGSCHGWQVVHLYISSKIYCLVYLQYLLFTKKQCSPKFKLSNHQIQYLYIVKLVYIPVPVGQAIGPPLDGWRWGMIESFLSGTEWPSHSHHVEDSDRHGPLYPVKGQEEVKRLSWLHDCSTEATMGKKVHCTMTVTKKWVGAKPAI